MDTRQALDALAELIETHFEVVARRSDHPATRHLGVEVDGLPVFSFKLHGGYQRDVGVELRVAGVSSERVPFYEAAEPPSWETAEALQEPPLRVRPDGGYEWAVDREAFAAELMTVAHARWEKWKADFLSVVSVEPHAWRRACERLVEHDDPWQLLYNPCDSPREGFAFPVESGIADCPFEVLHALLGMAPVLESLAPFSTPDCEHLLKQSFRLQPEREAGLAEDATKPRPGDGPSEPLPSMQVPLQQPARAEELMDWLERAGGGPPAGDDWLIEHLTGERFLSLPVREGWQAETCIRAAGAAWPESRHFLLPATPRLVLAERGEVVWQTPPPQLESPSFPVAARRTALRDSLYDEGLGFRLSFARPLDDGELAYASDLGQRWVEFYSDDNPELPLGGHRNYGEDVADDRRSIVFWMDRITIADENRVHMGLVLWLCEQAAGLLPVASVSFGVDASDELSASLMQRLGAPLRIITPTAIRPPTTLTFILAFAPVFFLRWLDVGPVAGMLAYGFAIGLPVVRHRHWFGRRAWLLWSGVGLAGLSVLSPVLPLAGEALGGFVSNALIWGVRAFFLAMIWFSFRDER